MKQPSKAEKPSSGRKRVVGEKTVGSRRAVAVRPAKLTAPKRPEKAHVELPAVSRPRGDVIQTVGRRKSAVARLRLTPGGQGSITVNGQDYRGYFPYPFWQETMIEPLPLVGLQGTVDISVKVEGGGLPSQAQAIRLALSRALIIHNPDWRPTLRKMGWLTRDPRVKERKKPGLKRARRAPQWQKR